MKGIPTSKKNLCPVCGNHHGCKIQDDKWVLCLRGSSQQDSPTWLPLRQTATQWNGRVVVLPTMAIALMGHGKTASTASTNAATGKGCISQTAGCRGAL
jgi:hypothetical protein